MYKAAQTIMTSLQLQEQQQRQQQQDSNNQTKQKGAMKK
jgi:hypothetical protein